MTQLACCNAANHPAGGCTSSGAAYVGEHLRNLPRVGESVAAGAARGTSNRIRRIVRAAELRPLRSGARPRAQLSRRRHGDLTK